MQSGPCGVDSVVVVRVRCAWKKFRELSPIFDFQKSGTQTVVKNNYDEIGPSMFGCSGPSCLEEEDCGLTHANQGLPGAPWILPRMRRSLNGVCLWLCPIKVLIFLWQTHLMILKQITNDKYRERKVPKLLEVEKSGIKTLFFILKVCI